jgi:UDP-N-acetylmuramate dehydrogenase
LNKELEKSGESLSEIDGLEIRKNYSLSRLTSIGTGGRTKIYVSVARVGALKKAMKLIKGPFFILGSGTNLLISDRDFPGVIIHLGCGFRRLRLEGDRISCGASVPLARLVKKAIENSFAGFEELSGVPGSAGGAAAMNAGTHIRELGDLVETLWMVDTKGRRRSFNSSAIQKKYRSSLAPVPGVITSLCFRRLPGSDPRRQAERAESLANGRKLKHPWRERTFGSTFKNPPGKIAAKLIDKAGLKGLHIGGARVSPVHAQFIENNQGASALDILELIKHVRQVVQERYGVLLEPEVRLVGFTAEELGDLAPYAISTIK